MNEDTDSSQSQLCRGLTECTQSPGVIDLMKPGMALRVWLRASVYLGVGRR